MPKFRRYYVPNALYFLTTVTRGRRDLFSDPENAALWRSNLSKAREIHPFTLFAYAVLPDHIHLLIRPVEKSNITRIMHSAKTGFTRAYKRERNISRSISLWQPRFWDHIIRDEEDLRRHIDYIHYNPVKHGLVHRPEDYAYSSYAHWQDRGFYEARWGWEEMDDRDLAHGAGEP